MLVEVEKSSRLSSLPISWLLGSVTVVLRRPLRSSSEMRAWRVARVSGVALEPPFSTAGRPGGVVGGVFAKGVCGMSSACSMMVSSATASVSGREVERVARGIGMGKRLPVFVQCRPGPVA